VSSDDTIVQAPAAFRVASDRRVARRRLLQSKIEVWLQAQNALQQTVDWNSIGRTPGM